ncbi:MAG: SRPBCC family protein [Kitasatospora sp.]|jgi:uncharacterized protein YndB with AHSA1/START domain|nr:SRPBCC family protein [Kitasatospora sp.]
MTVNGRVQVSVSRPIAASAAKIFQVLTDPANHPALDGSGMLRVAPDQPALGGAGDSFTIEMYLPDLGDYLMLNRVIAFERDRRIAWEPTPGEARTAEYAGLPVGASQGYSWGFQLEPDGGTTIVTETFDCTDAAQSIRDDVQDGQAWIPAMHGTLEQLATLVEPTPRGSMPAGPRPEPGA